MTNAAHFMRGCREVFYAFIQRLHSPFIALQHASLGVFHGVSDTNNDLANAIMQFTRHAAPLFFLSVKYPLGEFFKFGIGQTPFANV